MQLTPLLFGEVITCVCVSKYVYPLNSPQFASRSQKIQQIHASTELPAAKWPREDAEKRVSLQNSMTEPHIRTLLILFVISSIGDLAAVTIVDHYPIKDEYVLEHQVTYKDAIAEAKNLKMYPGPIPGCKECTSAEMRYCRDESILNDHCCCDGSYNKVFPFVEHICRVTRQPCKVLAGDCAEYTRLRECCCHSYLASLWKYLAGGANIKASNLTAIIGIFTALVIIRRLILY